MTDDRLELLFQAVLDNLRQILSIEIFCLMVRHLPDLFISTGNLRRIEIIRNRLEPFDALADLTRIRHHGLIGEI